MSVVRAVWGTEVGMNRARAQREASQREATRHGGHRGPEPRPEGQEEQPGMEGTAGARAPSRSVPGTFEEREVREAGMQWVRR